MCEPNVNDGNDEDADNGAGESLSRIRRLWSVGSTTGGKYVSVERGKKLIKLTKRENKQRYSLPIWVFFDFDSSILKSDCSVQ